MKKINIVGTSGSGKSTFSKQLADCLGYPYIELDSIYWGPNWSEPSDEVLFKNLETALDQEVWVLDGNYSRTTPIKWKAVDTVIWLDFSFRRTLYQAVRRAIYRAYTQQELWPGTGNRESWRLLFSKDSIVLWTLKSYWKIRKRYLAIMKDPVYAHITFVQLKSPKACKQFLESLNTL